MITFWFKETFQSIKKAQASFILSIISGTIAVTLILLSVMVFYLTEQFDQTIREDMPINLFVKDNPGDDLKKSISDKLNEKEYINSYTYLSKEEAAKSFIKETGEDFSKIIDYNPLPASFEVYLHKQYVQRDSIKKIQSDLKDIAGVEDIYFSSEVYFKLIDYLNKSKKYILGFTILLLFVSMYLIYSTNRLILHQRYDELNTMKLIGASLMSIKMPVILSSLIIGLTAGVLSFSIIYFLLRYFELMPGLPADLLKIVFVCAILSGPFFGILASYLSLRRVTLKI